MWQSRGPENLREELYPGFWSKLAPNQPSTEWRQYAFPTRPSSVGVNERDLEVEIFENELFVYSSIDSIYSDQCTTRLSISPQPVLAWAGVSPVLAAAGRCQWFSQWSETDTEKQFQFFTDESSEINIPKSLVHVEPFWHNFLCHSIVCGRRPLTLFQIQKDFKFIQEFPSSDLPAFTPRVWQVYYVFLSCLCVCVCCRAQL